MKGTLRVKFYHELGLEKLSSKRWIRPLCHYYKLLINKSPSHPYSLIPQPTSIIHRHIPLQEIPPLKTRTVAFQNSFFQNIICEWKFDIIIRGFTSFLTFKDIIITEIRPKSIFGIHNPLGLKFLTRFSMSFCHLKEINKHSFQDILDPFCNC